MKLGGAWIVIGLLFSLGAHADEVRIGLSKNLSARAEYWPGRPDKPAILILHGFLQTQESPTVHRLTRNLADEGYTVLAPTLSLGVPGRKQSLPCEAIHTHTLQDDVEEIDAWVGWLETRHTPIVLVGHSFGSIHLLAYLGAHPNRPIRQLIGISVIEGRLEGGERQRSRIMRTLRAQAARDRPRVVQQQFSFCKAYRGTPQSLLSYLQWAPGRILGQIGKTDVPVTFIMGGKDDLLGPGWIDRLKKARARVTMLEGANHFMEGTHEFTLLESVLDELRHP